MTASKRLELALTYILPHFEGKNKQVVTNLITDLVETVKEETFKSFETIHNKIGEIKLKKERIDLDDATYGDKITQPILIGGHNKEVLLYISPATNKILFKGQEINSKELIAALESIDITKVRDNLK